MERHKCENSASVVLMLPVPSPGKGGGVFSCVIKVFYVVLTQRFCVTSTMPFYEGKLKLVLWNWSGGRKLERRMFFGFYFLIQPYNWRENDEHVVR